MIKMIFRLIRHFLVWLLVCVPMMLLGMVVLAIVLPFIPKDVERLPSFLAWFDNHSGRLFDYPMGDGLAGDPPYRLLRASDGHTNVFWERFTWLALRNPINYFAYTVLGHTFGPKAYVSSLEGDVDVGDGGGSNGGFKSLELKDYANGLMVFGMMYVESVEIERTFYEYYYVKPYKLFGRSLCFHFRFGWKIGNQSEVVTGQTTEWVLTLNPFKPYTGA